MDQSLLLNSIEVTIAVVALLSFGALISILLRRPVLEGVATGLLFAAASSGVAFYISREFELSFWGFGFFPPLFSCANSHWCTEICFYNSLSRPFSRFPHLGNCNGSFGSHLWNTPFDSVSSGGVFNFSRLESVIFNIKCWTRKISQCFGYGVRQRVPS